MPFEIVNVTADQGATWTLALTYNPGGTPVNLTGYTARAQVRRSEGAPLLLDASTANGYITLGGSTGTVTITVPATVMATVPAGIWAWDLQLTSPASPPVVTRLAQGSFTVTPELIA